MITDDDYIRLNIKKEEVEGLQGDVTILVKRTRGKDSEKPTVGWKMKIGDKEYGDYIRMFVPDSLLK